METKTNLSKLRSAIISAVPGIEDVRTTKRDKDGIYKMDGGTRPIRLSDVLAAISSGYGKWAVDDVGCFWEMNTGEAWIPTEKRVEWNLSRDSLDEQPPEVHSFLCQVLGVE